MKLFGSTPACSILCTICEVVARVEAARVRATGWGGGALKLKNNLTHQTSSARNTPSDLSNDVPKAVTENLPCGVLKAKKRQGTKALPPTFFRALRIDHKLAVRSIERLKDTGGRRGAAAVYMHVKPPESFPCGQPTNKERKKTYDMHVRNMYINDSIDPTRGTRQSNQQV